MHHVIQSYCSTKQKKGASRCFHMFPITQSAVPKVSFLFSLFDLKEIYIQNATTHKMHYFFIVIKSTAKLRLKAIRKTSTSKSKLLQTCFKKKKKKWKFILSYCHIIQYQKDRGIQFIHRTLQFKILEQKCFQHVIPLAW